MEVDAFFVAEMQWVSWTVMAADEEVVRVTVVEVYSREDPGFLLPRVE